MKTQKFTRLTSCLLLTFFAVVGFFTSGNGQCPVPIKPATIQGMGSACPGQSKSYSINPVSGASSYTWTLPSGATINGSNPYTGSSTTVTIDYGVGFTPPGTISVVSNNACGSSPARTLTVKAYYPGIPSNIYGDASACVGDVITFNVDPYTDAISYTWTVPLHMSIQSGQGTRTVDVEILSGFSGNESISVAANYGCGTGTQRTKNIVKKNPPQAPNLINGDQVACPLDIKSYSVDALPGYSYTWTIPSGASLTGQGTANVDVTFPAGFIDGKIQCKYTNNCGTSPNASLQVNATPTIPGLIDGDATGICNGTRTYTVAPLAGQPTYTWTVPAGATLNSGQGTNSISVTFSSFSSGNISVNATNNCGVSKDRDLSLSSNIVIAQQPVSNSACEGTSSSLSVDVPGVGLTYQWKFDNNPLSDNSEYSGTQTSTLNLLNLDSLEGGNYTVEISSACASAVNSNIAVFTVNMRPPVPSPIASAPVYGCPGTIGLQLSVLPGGYNTLSNYWQTEGDVDFTSGQNTNQVTVDLLPTSFSGYTIYVKGENACGLSYDSSKTWIRYKSSVPTITSGPALVCQGQSNVIYSADPVAGATNYTWSVTPGIVLNSGQGTLTADVSFDPGFTSGQICINSETPCFTSANRCINVNFNQPARPSNITGPSSNLCNTIETFSVSPVAGATSYDWTLPSGATINSGAGTNTVDISFSGAVSGNLCVAAVNNCTTGLPRCKKVESQEMPATIICDSHILCVNQTNVTFTCSTVPNTTSYVWTVPQGSAIVSGQGTNSILVNLGSTTGKVGVRAFNSCGQSKTKTYPVDFACRMQAPNPEAGSFLFDVYPNPAKDKFFVAIKSTVTQTISVSVVDLLGKNVKTDLVPVHEGLNKIVFETSGMLSGIYFVMIKTAEGSHQSRIVIE